MDPGKMSGFATWSKLTTAEVHDAWAVPAGETPAALREWCNTYATRPAAVVCEDIVITAQTARKSQDVKTSLELIGVAKYLCHCFQIPILMQTPSDAKMFATDDKLRAINWWTKGLDHPRDASRHLLTFLANHGLVDLKALLHALDSS